MGHSPVPVEPPEGWAPPAVADLIGMVFCAKNWPPVFVGVAVVVVEASVIVGLAMLDDIAMNGPWLARFPVSSN